MPMSMSIGTLLTFLSLIGTPSSLLRALRHLFKDKLQLEDCGMVLGVAYFLLMFLPIPFVHAGALFGYWTPRLILPALLYFFWAAFLLIDRKIAGQQTIVAVAALLLALVQCAIEAVMLI